MNETPDEKLQALLASFPALTMTADNFFNLNAAELEEVARELPLTKRGSLRALWQQHHVQPGM